MKVYTHYYKNNNLAFRWRTLLQFGDSWEVIGTIVMKNPGTASPIDIVCDAEILAHLSRFDDNGNSWYEFSADSTMNCVGELFAYYYSKANRHELNGVIQIFNLFYIKDGNLFNALKKDEGISSPFIFSSEYDILNYDLERLVMPVYLGFADLAFHKKYKDRAMLFYNKAKSLGMNYCHPDFMENRFIHPQYLMLYGKNKQASINVRNDFKLNQYTGI